MVNKETNMVKLGDILSTSFTNGIYKSSDYYGTGVSILRITDFNNNGHLVTDDLQRVELSDAEVSNYKLQSKDIVINRVNSLTHIGKSILWMNTKNEMTVYESNMMRIKPKESVVLPEYLIKILHSYSARNHYKRVAKRAIGQSSINQQDVKSLLFFLPPLSEQQKIAKILSTWDKAISTTERLIDNSTQQKKALMQQLLTGKKRLLDDERKRFESKWEEGKLADFAKIKKGKALSSKDLKKGSYPVIAGGKSSPYNHSDFTHENIITVSASGAYAGYIAYFDYKIWASDCSVVEPRGDNNIKYLYYWLSNQQRKIYNLQSGGAQPHIYPRDLDSLKISIPNLKEQQKIATVLTNADKEIELLEQQLADLQQEKKALMQVLLTGKKRVVVDGVSLT